MIINTENYMVMIFSYSNADDKVKISKFRDGKYYMNSIEIQDNNVSETLQNMNEKGLWEDIESNCDAHFTSEDYDEFYNMMVKWIV